MPLPKDSRILLVDDSPAILVHLKGILEKRGYDNVVTTTSVEDGLDEFATTRPDVVFVDLIMPSKSGLHFVKKVLHEDPHASIVVSTALARSEEAVIEAIAQGATDYLQKPLREDAVAAVLRHLGPEEKGRHEPSYV